MKWNDALSHVLPSVNGCPDQLAVDHLIKAARDFASRTLVWQYEAPTISTVAGIADYTLQIPTTEELVRLMLCEVDGSAYLIPNGFTGRQMVRQGRTNICAVNNPRDFTLSPAPTTAGLAIVTEVAVKPAFSSLKWPDDLDEHIPDIAHGAMATLLCLPNVSWRDEQACVREGALFMARCSATMARVSKGYGSTRRRGKVSWF